MNELIETFVAFWSTPAQVRIDAEPDMFVVLAEVEYSEDGLVLDDFTSQPKISGILEDKGTGFFACNTEKPDEADRVLREHGFVRITRWREGETMWAEVVRAASPG